MVCYLYVKSTNNDHNYSSQNNIKQKNSMNKKLVLFLFAVASFDFPLQLSIDYRPTFYLVKNSGDGGNYNDVCLSARYRF